MTQGQPTSSSEALRSLRALCERHREEIIDTWNARVQSLAPFASVPAAETRANVLRCFDAFFARLAHQDRRPLEVFARELARQRFDAGFEIDGPLTAASRFRAAVRQVFRNHGGAELPDSVEVGEQLSAAVDVELDAFNREFSAAFAKLLVEDSASRMRELFDDASDVLMRVDREGKILDVNERVVSLFGFAREAWQQQALSSLIVDGEQRCPPLLERIFAGESVQAEFVDVHTATGDAKRCVLHAHRSRAPGPEEAVVVLRDVSPEDALRAQVIQSEKMASIGYLSASVAHELNNPLAWVLSNLEQIEMLLERDAKSSDAPETKAESSEASESSGMLNDAITDALAGVARMADIVADLRDFARTEGDDRELVQVHEAIELALRICDTQIGYRTQVVREYEEIPAIRGHAGRLSQVFVNLLINSAQAMGHPDPAQNVITIRTRLGRQEECDVDEEPPEAVADAVVIEVSDEGPGIPPEQREAIFAPFVTTKGKSGTGLGLWVCRNIVEEHGGTMDLVDAADGGAMFRICLPLAE